MATLHSPSARWPASSSALVTIPTGLVKSMIQAVLQGPLACPFGNVEHYRDGAESLREPAGAGGLLADAAVLQRPGLVALPGRLAADPQLQQHGPGAVQALVEAGGPASAGPGWPWARMIRSENGPTTASRASSGSTRTSSSTATSPGSRAMPSTSSGV